jgi:hypothetical protein
MSSVANWEFEPGNSVVVTKNYWRGAIGWVTEVQQEFIRITLTIGISILARREELALITIDESTDSEDSANGVVILEEVLDDESDAPAA